MNTEVADSSVATEFFQQRPHNAKHTRTNAGEIELWRGCRQVVPYFQTCLTLARTRAFYHVFEGVNVNRHSCCV
jgi:hypothetical protein